MEHSVDKRCRRGGGDASGSPTRKNPRQRLATTRCESHTAAAGIEQLRRRGYVAVPSFLTADELQMLRRESSALFAALHEDPTVARDKLVENGCVLDTMADSPMEEDSQARVDTQEYLGARACQLRQIGPSDPGDDAKTLEGLLFRRLPDLISRLWEDHDAVPSRSLYFFNEHYVVKPPHTDVEFRWHRDDDEQLAMCIHREEIAPYVSAWCALDDVTLHNGPLRFVGLDKLSESVGEPSVDELEALACEPFVVEAGTVLLFFSGVWHFSSSNPSSTTRRAFYAQYSRHPITATPRDAAPLSFAIPCMNSDV